MLLLSSSSFFNHSFSLSPTHSIKNQSFKLRFNPKSVKIGLIEEPHRNSTEELHQSRSCCGLRKKKNTYTNQNKNKDELKPKMTTTNEATTQPPQQMMSLSFSSQMSKEDEEMARSALSAFRAKEDEIEKRKMEVRERVKAQLGRVEEETRRLASIREELETMADPMRKEVNWVRKKIDSVNKELKPLGSTVQKKEREYKEALDTFNEKNREKVQLITKLMEMGQLVGESEKLRLKKLDELSRSIDTESESISQDKTIPIKN
jgi:chromosome segregation ATPase